MSICTNKLGRAFIVASGYSPGMCSLWIYISQEPEIHPPLLRTPFMYDHRHAFDAVPLSPVPRGVHVGEDAATSSTCHGFSSSLENRAGFVRLVLVSMHTKPHWSWKFPDDRG